MRALPASGFVSSGGAARAREGPRRLALRRRALRSVMEGAGLLEGAISVGASCLKTGRKALKNIVLILHSRIGANDPCKLVPEAKDFA
ncbi:hypothetical protein GRO01_01560 [Gluconobacter roseus NBRC 3990]|uniref:Uncharacterized protein n=1 Tax=Gluconobacter roseus NBRC 3990 TaxID=1307950 RepID=A0A4Y3M009_9PROT|nr:hypothetical protein GRO01_01560 [Gluconobacter roseus NBRC 3990]GLP93040.1 hypothetical protein GCM10007871_10180 [Gluconobacter roseus NBRC 3990]